VNYTLEHFGDKWSFLIIRDLMFKGKRHYNEFLEGGESISTSVLGDRLRKLEENGIVSKGPDAVKKSRIRYSLTEKGVDLLPVLIDMIVWGATHDAGTEAPHSFIEMATGNRQLMIEQTRKKLIEEHLGG
jgi:DNA-binding HxlR family transcriptional regulator